MLAAFLCTGACAEIAGQTPQGYIHRIALQDGQEIYYLSDMESEYILQQDVNFDGADDLVVLTINGASNAGYEFFLNIGGKYIWAQRETGPDNAIYNYELDAERRLVISRANNGGAGSMHQITVYRYDGKNMVPVRTAVGENPETVDFYSDHYVTVTDLSALHLAIYAADQTVIWEYTLAGYDKPESDEELMNALKKEEEMLLFGL